MRRDLQYDDAFAVDIYLLRNRDRFATPLEARAERLGILREKARWNLAEPDGQSVRSHHLASDRYAAATDEDVEAAIGNGLESFKAFQESVTRRIQTEYEQGRILVLRCPACTRVAFSPDTRQCIWCGHNWRD